MIPRGHSCCPPASGGRSPPTRSSGIDRKSTRLNSSHLVISYAVFCLKKKKNNREVRSEEHFSRHLALPAFVVPPEEDGFSLGDDLLSSGNESRPSEDRGFARNDHGCC